MPRSLGYEARSDKLSRDALTTAGQIRYLALVSLLLTIWLSFQAQFFTISNFVWLSFHHVSSPVAIAVTFLRRGTQVAVYALAVAAAADFVLASTSAVMVLRCFDIDQAAENCPDRLVQGGWILLYSGNQLAICLFELTSMWTLQSALDEQRVLWDQAIAEEAARDAESAKLMLTNAKTKRIRRLVGVERRLSIFALVPGIAVWAFGDPSAAGWLAIVALTRPLRDAFGIWASYRIKDGNNTQREFYDTLTTVISGIYLALSLGAFLYSEQLKTPIQEFSAQILIDAAKSAYDDPFSFMSSAVGAEYISRPEPFLIAFAFVETLVLCNKNTPVRA